MSQRLQPTFDGVLEDHRCVPAGACGSVDLAGAGAYGAATDVRVRHAVIAVGVLYAGLTTTAAGAPSCSLVRLPGSLGCVSDLVDDAADLPCAHARIGLVTGTEMSPDGRHLYVADSYTIWTFSRNAATGTLQPMRRARGCGGSGVRGHAAQVRGMSGIRQTAFSPDSRSLYVPLQEATDRVLAFRRTPDGSLRRLAGRAGCVEASAGSSCRSARRFSYAFHGAVSPDGRNVYFGTEAGMAAFRRGARGPLTQLPGVFGCNSSFREQGCRLTNVSVEEDADKWVVVPAGGRHVCMVSSYLIELFHRTP